MARAFYDSQLVKYLPAGGFAQAAGQVTLTATTGVSVAQVTLAYIALAALTVASCFALGVVLVFAGGATFWIRIVGIVSVLCAVVLVYRGTLVAVLDLADVWSIGCHKRTYSRHRTRCCAHSSGAARTRPSRQQRSS